MGHPLTATDAVDTPLKATALKRNLQQKSKAQFKQRLSQEITLAAVFVFFFHNLRTSLSSTSWRDCLNMKTTLKQKTTWLMSKKCYLESFVHMQEYHFFTASAIPVWTQPSVTRNNSQDVSVFIPHSSTILFLLCRCCTIGVQHQRHCLLCCLVWEGGCRVVVVRCEVLRYSLSCSSQAHTQQTNTHTHAGRNQYAQLKSRKKTRNRKSRSLQNKHNSNFN